MTAKSMVEAAAIPDSTPAAIAFKEKTICFSSILSLEGHRRGNNI
jgi:hypothetical protein